MEDRELFSKLQELGGQITPPESLSPGAVGEALKGVRRKRPAVHAAAVCALVLAVAFASAVFTSDLNGGGLLSPNSAPVSAVEEQNNSYDTIYNAIARAIKTGIGHVATGEAQTSLDYEPPGSVNDTGAALKTYTDTNEQTAGVQEGDIVKTDGKYIYTVDGEDLTVFRAEDGNVTKLASVSIAGAGRNGTKNKTSFHPLELFISGDTIAVICSETGYIEGAYSGEEEMMDCGAVVCGSTEALIYDVSDRSAPKLLNTLEQSGYYLASRMADGTLYLVSNYFVPRKGIKKNRPETFVPVLTSGGKSRPADSRDISISKSQPQIQYTTVTSLDLDHPTDFKSGKAVMGGGSSVYCSTESLYLGVFVYEEDAPVPHTQLIKYSLNGGDIVFTAEAEVDGTLLNQFSMDESGGYFRVVTSYTKMKETFQDGIASAQIIGEVQRLYVLDKSLALCGTFENQSKNERLQSVRFVGDCAYFVTFEQTDPLFSVDLSDPYAPELLGALEIPGFSQYLHPCGENRLLGFGVDANEDGETTGLKLSMFDTTDRANVKQIAAQYFSDNMSYSPAQYNHKALMFDQQHNLIGIPVLEDDSRVRYEGGSRVTYYLFSYSEAEGFVQKARLYTQKRTAQDDNVRGVVIGDYFYLCDAPDIVPYPLSDFA